MYLKPVEPEVSQYDPIRAALLKEVLASRAAAAEAGNVVKTQKKTTQKKPEEKTDTTGVGQLVLHVPEEDRETDWVAQLNGTLRGLRVAEPLKLEGDDKIDDFAEFAVLKS